MPDGLEITKATIYDFKKIQEYMALAKEENATKTYANNGQHASRTALMLIKR